MARPVKLAAREAHIYTDLTAMFHARTVASAVGLRERQIHLSDDTPGHTKAHSLSNT